MPDQKVTIICPYCQKSVSVDDVLTHQIQNKFQQEFDIQLQKEKVQLWKIAQEKALEKIKSQQTLENKLLKEELEEKRKSLEKMQQQELDLRRAKNKLEEEKQIFELEKQRQIDSEREKIKADVAKILSEEHQFKDAEKEKIIGDMRKTIEELKRKSDQGSQQLQGEVLELELEELLKSEFPNDEIEAVAKGTHGADILQRIFDRYGKFIGIIAWESKRTKAWSDSWIPKLKDDLRNAKAEIAVLVSMVLPQEIKNFGPKDGIYISNYECALGVAHLLRTKIIQVTQMRLAQNGKNEKKEILWNYLISTEFKHRMESIFEAFLTMKSDLEREKQASLRMWARREKQLQRLTDNTSGMRGELEGLIGNELPEIKSIELTEKDDDITSALTDSI